MLKEELEKQLGVKVTNSFYATANGLYVQGPFRNNREFCEMLKQNKLLMHSLKESARMRNLVQQRIMERSSYDTVFMRELQIM